MRASEDDFNSPIVRLGCGFILLFILFGVLLTVFDSDPEPVSEVVEEAATEVLVNVDTIAGKTPEQVAAVLGEPEGRESVNPSNTPCPCDKVLYKDGKVEIVYMNGLSDWITVNYPPRFIEGDSKYLSVDQFPRYTYVKVKTP